MKYFFAFIKIAVTIPFVCYLIWLTLTNRGTAFDFHWNPLNDIETKFSLPLVLFIAVVVGFVWGSFILWANLWPVRADNFKKRRKIDELQYEIERLQADNVRLNKLIQTPIAEELPQRTLLG